MKYFRWSESEIMNMTYDKFTMYLATIPDYETEETDKRGTTDTTTGKKYDEVKTVNMFDFLSNNK